MLIFVAVATGLVAVYWLVLTVRPLSEKRVFSAEDWSRLEDDSMELLARRDRLIEELRDIEFEASLDKIDERDLELLRRRYEDEALRLMGRLESEHHNFEDRIAADIEDLLGRIRSRVSSEPDAASLDAPAPEIEGDTP